MAGEEGFEPSHGGIKIRCLNQLGDSPSAKLAPATPRADADPARARRSRASRSVANSTNTQAPEALMRASPNCLSLSRCAATSAWRLHTTDSRSFLPKPAEKLDILKVFEFRVNSG